MAKRQISGGNFQDSLGNPLNGGSVTFRLSTDAVAVGTQVAAAILTTAVLDASGNISGTVSIWPNDQLTPVDTVYRIVAYTAHGPAVWKSENVIPSGIGAFDIGTLTPLY